MMSYTKAAAVTLHDTNSQSIDTRFGTPLDGIYVGVGGDVKMTLSGAGESAVTFKNMIAGTLYPLSAKVLFSTDTAATNLVALDTGSQYD